MKARRKVRRFEGLMVGGLCFALCQITCAQSFSEKKNLFQLREMVFPNVSSKYALLSNERLAFMYADKTSKISNHQYLTQPDILDAQSPTPNQSFLPRWSAESLPFFCRIEHDVAKKSTVPFKFRLGSVEYVDWLEGKGNDWSH